MIFGVGTLATVAKPFYLLLIGLLNSLFDSIKQNEFVNLTFMESSKPNAPKQSKIEILEILDNIFTLLIFFFI